jgi:hypothetical protein
VPYPTLPECYSLVMRELGIRTAHEFLEEVVRGSIFENASSEDYQKASLRVLRYKDQDITLVDAVIAEIADRLDAPVWTFDHHFRRDGGKRLAVIEGRIAAGFSSSPMTEAPCYAERAVDALLAKGFGIAIPKPFIFLLLAGLS